MMTECTVYRALWSTCWKWLDYWGSRACCRNSTAIISTASSYWHCWWLYSQFWHIGWRVSGILLDERNSSSTLQTGLLVCIDVCPSYFLTINNAKSWHSLSAIVLSLIVVGLRVNMITFYTIMIQPLFFIRNPQKLYSEWANRSWGFQMYGYFWSAAIRHFPLPHAHSVPHHSALCCHPLPALTNSCTGARGWRHATPNQQLLYRPSPRGPLATILILISLKIGDWVGLSTTSEMTRVSVEP